MVHLIEQIASDEVLEQAYQWLCERRKNYSHNDEVWELRRRWAERKRAVQRQLLAGQYRFAPLRAPTRWKLRRAVKIVNQTLNELQVEQHPDKTFVGPTSRGFSFLGYDFDGNALVGVAQPTRERFVERIRRLYEQCATLGRVGDYVRRWWIWVKSGLPSSAFDACASGMRPLRPALPAIST